MAGPDLSLRRKVNKGRNQINRKHPKISGKLISTNQRPLNSYYESSHKTITTTTTLELKYHRRHSIMSSASHHSQGVNALMLACLQNKAGDVQTILKKNPETLNAKTKTGRTPLHFAAECGSCRCIELILGANPNLIDVGDEEKYTAVHLAVINGHREALKTLISAKANLNAVDEEKHSAVHWATVCGELDILDILLSAGALASTPDIHMAHPLHYAAQLCGNGNRNPTDSRVRIQSTSVSAYGISPRKGLAILRRLLQHGVPVDIKDKDGRQPLLWASSAGNADGILELVNAGANIQAEDKDGLTALHCAASRGHTDCLETLIALCGAEVDVIDNNGCTALFYAVTLGHADCTELLLNYGVEPNRQDRKGRSPAHCGAAKGQLETMKLFAKHGGNLWLRNVRGDLPLHEAILSRRKDLVLWLLSQRPDVVNSSNNDGRCPIHLAALTNNVEMVKILVDYNADVNQLMRTSKGVAMTPLDAAIHKGNSAVAKFLQLHGGLPANSLHIAALQQRIQSQARSGSRFQDSRIRGGFTESSPEPGRASGYKSTETLLDEALVGRYAESIVASVLRQTASTTPIAHGGVQTDPSHYLRDMEVQVSNGFDFNDLSHEKLNTKQNQRTATGSSSFGSDKKINRKKRKSIPREKSPRECGTETTDSDGRPIMRKPRSVKGKSNKIVTLQAPDPQRLPNQESEILSTQVDKLVRVNQAVDRGSTSNETHEHIIIHKPQSRISFSDQQHKNSPSEADSSRSQSPCSQLKANSTGTENENESYSRREIPSGHQSKSSQAIHVSDSPNTERKNTSEQESCVVEKESMSPIRMPNSAQPAEQTHSNEEKQVSQQRLVHNLGEEKEAPPISQATSADESESSNSVDEAVYRNRQQHQMSLSEDQTTMSTTSPGSAYPHYETSNDDDDKRLGRPKHNDLQSRGMTLLNPPDDETDSSRHLNGKDFHVEGQQKINSPEEELLPIASALDANQHIVIITDDNSKESLRVEKQENQTSRNQNQTPSYTGKAEVHYKKHSDKNKPEKRQGNEKPICQGKTIPCESIELSNDNERNISHQHETPFNEKQSMDSNDHASVFQTGVDSSNDDSEKFSELENFALVQSPESDQRVEELQLNNPGEKMLVSLPSQGQKQDEVKQCVDQPINIQVQSEGNPKVHNSQYKTDTLTSTTNDTTTTEPNTITETSSHNSSLSKDSPPLLPEDERSASTVLDATSLRTSSSSKKLVSTLSQETDADDTIVADNGGELTLQEAYTRRRLSKLAKARKHNALINENTEQAEASELEETYPDSKKYNVIGRRGNRLSVREQFRINREMSTNLKVPCPKEYAQLVTGKEHKSSEVSGTKVLVPKTRSLPLRSKIPKTKVEEPTTFIQNFGQIQSDNKNLAARQEPNSRARKVSEGMTSTHSEGTVGNRDSGFSDVVHPTTSASEDQQRKRFLLAPPKSTGAIRRKVIVKRPLSGSSAAYNKQTSLSTSRRKTNDLKPSNRKSELHESRNNVGLPHLENGSADSTSQAGSITSEDTKDYGYRLQRPRSKLTFTKGENLNARASPYQKKNLDVDTPISVTQAMQASMRKYHLERKIFQELLELKRLQIRAGKANEQILVKRMADDYRKSGTSINYREYDGPYTFRNFEKYLYDQLRLLQANRKLLPRFAPSDDIDKLSSALKKMNATRLPFLDESDRHGEQCPEGEECRHLTHRCHHASHAYIGIPCAAYISKGRRTPFLPKVDPLKAPGPTNRSRLSQAASVTTPMPGVQMIISPRENVTSPITVEVQQGINSQVFSLPNGSLDPTRNYYVSLSIKPSPTPSRRQATTGNIMETTSVSAPPPTSTVGNEEVEKTNLSS